jgi:hypothetical protein
MISMKVLQCFTWIISENLKWIQLLFEKIFTILFDLAKEICGLLNWRKCYRKQFYMFLKQALLVLSNIGYCCFILICKRNIWMLQQLSKSPEQLQRLLEPLNLLKRCLLKIRPHTDLFQTRNYFLFIRFTHYCNHPWLKLLQKTLNYVSPLLTWQKNFS